MAVRRLSPSLRFVFAAVAAVVAHVVIMGLMLLAEVLDVLPALNRQHIAVSSNGQSPKSETDDQPMQIETLVDELQRPDEKSEQEKKREEEKKKEEEDKNPHGQVVDVAKPLIEQRPDKANYVSEFDTKVERETKMMGREQGGAKNGATPAPPPVPQGERPDARPQAQSQPGKGGKPGPLAMRELHQRPQPHGADEAPPPPDRDGEVPQHGRNGAPTPLRNPAATGQMGDGRTRTPGSEGPSGQPGMPRPNLQPTPEMLQRAIGKGGGSMDYLKNVDDGDATALNSKKWKHAPFFNRLKRQVADEWHPELVYVRHDPNGNVYGIKDRVTVLRIHLLPDGKLATWTVLQSSGVDFLDDEAIDAFRKAAPFPNPPKDLIEADGQIHFNFAFIFELSGHGSLKVYKYN